MVKLLMIDNLIPCTTTWCSLGEVGPEVKVIRNDELSIAEIEALRPETASL